ncbi:TetR family transcriptional regulator [Vitiosangium sp. GDMCC 1.1324]|nr:TetR family transcriptional regulator [Vitiosangium sp. GDMCC 1.1324]
MSHMRRRGIGDPPSSAAPSGTRALLLSTAAQVFAANPSASLDEVARTAGVGRATLHRHFGSRTELIRAAGLDAIAQLEQALRAHPFEKLPPAAALDAMATALVPWGEKLRFLLVASELEEDPELKAAEARVDERIGAVLDRAREKGVLRRDVPLAWLFSSFEALLYAAWMAVARGDLAANDASRTFLETFLHGHAVSSLPGGRQENRR